MARFKSTDYPPGSAIRRQLEAAERQSAELEQHRQIDNLAAWVGADVDRRARRATAAAAGPNAGEALLALQLRAHGIEHETEYRFHVERGWRFDFAIPSARIGIEIEGGIWKPGGGAHSHPSNIERDLMKYNAATLAGWRIFRFMPDKHVRTGLAVAMIVEALKPTNGD